MKCPWVCNLSVYDGCPYWGVWKIFPEVDLSSKKCIQAKGEYFEGQGRIKGSKINKCGWKQPSVIIFGTSLVSKYEADVEDYSSVVKVQQKC